jgi:hypothetical protein
LFVFARLLDTWQYYITVILNCLAVAITLLLASSDSKSAQCRRGFSFHSLGAVGDRDASNGDVSAQAMIT